MTTNKTMTPKTLQRPKAENKAVESLEGALDKVSLPDAEVGKIESGEFKKSLRDILLETTGIGKAIKIALDYNKAVNEQIRQKKKELLLSLYFKKTEKNEDAINKIERLLTNPQGNILFNKILGILDDGTPNLYYIQMLANTLKYIADSEFDRLFEKHKYTLDRIGRLTPQALVILNDRANWPRYQIGNYSSSSGIITSEWVKYFVPVYASSRGIDNEKKQRRIAHVLKELLADDLIRSRLPGQNDSRDYGSIKESKNVAICEPTELGEEILSYIGL